MSDLELDVEILFPEANFNSHIEKGTIEMSDEYFNLLQEKMARLISENQKLKKQLEEKENQQKEFIEYLKDKEKQFDIMGDPINSGACSGILLRYKEIIGKDINVSSKNQGDKDE